MQTNTKSPIEELKEAVLEVETQFEKVLAMGMKEVGPEGDRWPRWLAGDSVVYSDAYQDMKRLFEERPTYKDSLVWYGEIPEEHSNFLKACKDRQAYWKWEELPDDVQKAWTDLLTAYKEVEDKAKKAYCRRGVKWKRCMEPRSGARWGRPSGRFLAVELPHTDPESSLKQEVPLGSCFLLDPECDGSLLSFPAENGTAKHPDDDSEKLRLERYFKEIRRLKAPPPFDVKASADRLSATATLLDSARENETSDIPALKSEDWHTLMSERDLPLSSTVLIIPLDNDSNEILVKPPGTVVKSWVVSFEPSSLKADSNGNPTVSFDAHSSFVEASKMTFGLAPDIADWTRAAERISPMLRSQAASLRE